jgi:hypothetical protein
MALTAAQRTQIRLVTGWQDGFGQFDSRLEQAMNYADSRPELLAQLQNAIDGSPPGLLASIAAIDTKLLGAHTRMKALAAGSLTLNPAELQQLRSEGRRFVGRLCAILGVEARHDYFSGSLPREGGNWVGR